MEEMLVVEVTRISVALGWTNLVLVRAIKDLKDTPTSESEERRTE